MGLASTRPVASGDTPEAREANRRVELVLEAGSAEALLDPR